jgi:hypothetical protein
VGLSKSSRKHSEVLRNTIVSSRKDRANLKWESEREETFYLRER